MSEISFVKNPATNEKVYFVLSGQGYGTCDTTTATAGARIVTLSGYNAVKGFVSVMFQYDVPASATMNINGQGAYPIKKDGAAIGNNVIAGGTTQMFYFDGSAFNLLFFGIAAQSDWEESDSSDPSYIANKPSIKAGVGAASIVEGYTTYNKSVARGGSSHAEGNSFALGDYAHSEGYGSAVTLKNGSTNVYVTYEIGTQYTYSTDIAHGLKVGDVVANAAPDSNSFASSVVTSVTDSTHFTLRASIGELNSSTIKVVKGSASGNYSHVEGYINTSSGGYSHAEGEVCVAYGNGSHAEGGYARAVGARSHAEGNETVSNGRYSHAEGCGTYTTNQSEHAQGQFNLSNNSNTDALATAFSIGIGSSESDRKNAVEVMQNGDMYVYGIGGYDGTNPTAASSLQQVIQNILNQI